MQLKHAIKTGGKALVARGLWTTGAHRIVDRMRARRLTILYGHCVTDDALNGPLHGDMKIDGEKLAEILRALGAGYDFVTVSEGMDRLRAGDAGRSMVALTMDDGYRDNLERLVPLLEETGARATVFLEAGAVVDRQLPWLHALGHAVARLGAPAVAAELAERIPEAAASLGSLIGEHPLKRALKYDVDPATRERALSDLVREVGVDPSAIVDELYLSGDEARALARSEHVEIGGHTVSHPVLARLGPAEQLEEIRGGAEKLAALLGADCGRAFAYPYGRRWDFDAASEQAVVEAGYEYAVTTHEGVNGMDSVCTRLARIPISNRSALADIAATASGVYARSQRTV